MCISVHRHDLINELLHLHRYQKAINELADKHWPNDIVLVTHKYGVEQALAMGGKEKSHLYLYVPYCGNLELVREEKGGQWSIASMDRISEYEEFFEH